MTSLADYQFFFDCGTSYKCYRELDSIHEKAGMSKEQREKLFLSMVFSIARSITERGSLEKLIGSKGIDESCIINCGFSDENLARLVEYIHSACMKLCVIDQCLGGNITKREVQLYVIIAKKMIIPQICQDSGDNYLDMDSLKYDQLLTEISEILVLSLELPVDSVVYPS